MFPEVIGVGPIDDGVESLDGRDELQATPQLLLAEVAAVDRISDVVRISTSVATSRSGTSNSSDGWPRHTDRGIRRASTDNGEETIRPAARAPVTASSAESAANTPGGRDRGPEMPGQREIHHGGNVLGLTDGRLRDKPSAVGRQPSAVTSAVSYKP
jgi:hypothetical protein